VARAGIRRQTGTTASTTFRPAYHHRIRTCVFFCDCLQSSLLRSKLVVIQPFTGVFGGFAQSAHTVEVDSSSLSPPTGPKPRRILELGYLPAVGSGRCTTFRGSEVRHAEKAGHAPTCKLHKPSAQARVMVQGRQVCLGRFGSDESREKYARIKLPHRPG